MKLEKIITLANTTVLHQFLAMERSLRATGCELPLWVIPYNDERFDLPQNAHWWENDYFYEFLNKNKAKPAMRRYACLTESNFHYIDSDCVFLQNPEKILTNLTGWVTCCCHWNNPDHTFTKESLIFLQKKSTTWQKSVFNSGQFACDTPLYSWDSLLDIIQSPEKCQTILKDPFHDQPGVNWLVALKDNLNYTNLTLPPYNLESSWAGDYVEYPSRLWENSVKMPYVIHWAGQKPDGSKKIDELFFKYLKKEEKDSYFKNLSIKKVNYLQKFKNKLRRGWHAFLQNDN